VKVEEVTGTESGEVFMDGVLGFEEGRVAKVEVFEGERGVGGG
jgi:hypothetical protein